MLNNQSRYRAELEALEDRITPALTDGLLSLWAFEGSGADSSGNQRDLALVGAPGFAGGRFGQALSLTGDASQFAQRPGDDSVFDFGSSDFTVQAWINLNTLTGEQTIVEKFVAAAGPGWTLSKPTNNNVFFAAPPNIPSLDSDTDVAENTWHHLVTRRMGNDFEMFLDGVSVASLSDNDAVVGNGNPLIIGRRAGGQTFPVDGRIDEVAIWNRSLSDGEVIALANGTSLAPSFQHVIQFESFVTGLSAPVAATHAGDGSGRLFVVEQGGRIRVVDNGSLLATAFLDISSDIAGGGERGLLGLAFHPDYATPAADGEGRFFVYYSAPATFGGNHDSVVSEFQVSSGDPNVADPNSERELFRFNQPRSGHNAGDMKFGPDDGLLYIATGDGGGAGDPDNLAQDRSNLLGNILRIDVDGSNAPGGQYGIPASNPFVGEEDVREEIYAYGFRNPFRMSFDDGPNGAASPDRLFVGDVGQGAFEEVDIVVAGGNYGWRIREGAHPFSNDPDPGNLIDPIAEYPNLQPGTAIIGGFVYRGNELPPLDGVYIFADFGGDVYTLVEENGQFKMYQPNLIGGNPFGQSIIGFGEDEEHNLYVLTFSGMFRINLTPDFGDAPDSEVASPSYATLAENDGPRHFISTAIFLGATVDEEEDAIPNTNANGDDGDGAPNDEDGITDPAAELVFPIGDQPSVDVVVTNNTGDVATLSGWIDFNNDGVFDNNTERAQIAVPNGTIGQIVTLNFPVVPNGFTGTTYARFRLSTDAAADNPTGLANDGEVEDYVVTIYDPSTISDFVWHDLDEDGVQDDGEPGISGARVELFATSDGIIGDGDDRSIGVQITGGDGLYEFGNLQSGNYYVDFDPPNGFVFTSQNVGDPNLDSDAHPTTGRTGLIILAEGEVNDSIDAGVFEPPIDLHITKTDNGQTARPGGTVVYNITYGNNGDATADNVVLVETAPVNTTFVAADSTPGWTLTGAGVFSLNVGSLGPAATGTATFAVHINRPFPVGMTQITNNVAIANDGSHGADADPSDNQASEATPIRRTQQFTVIGADAGGGPHVRTIDPATNTTRLSFFAYDPAFVGGVRVAAGDVNGDGVADIITAPGIGGGPHIKVFDGVSGSVLRSFFAYTPGFTGGVYVAAGDINGDGIDDIVTGAGATGGPHVRVFDGATGVVIRDFFAYGPTFAGGVRVAAGDVNGDGIDDVITGAGIGGGPHVRVFSGVDNTVLRDLFAYAPTFVGGVFVASGDVNGDGRDEVIVSAHVTLPVMSFDGVSGAELAAFIAFPTPPVNSDPLSVADPTGHGNIRVATVDVNGDGQSEIMAGTGGGFLPEVRVFDGVSLSEIDQFFAFAPSFLGGMFVGDN